jgi:hypothetical protein
MLTIFLKDENNLSWEGALLGKTSKKKYISCGYHKKPISL